ncbi:chemotaxis protein [Vogesella sp. EB]|uniref:methyl-accepting chemotaxis protein n=1 Tax=Vogesella sp. EB TaxID=1526735 RepID=UPI00064D1B08|nr:methyl-accepting chemotaxis protein [Vogesella sp. EB]KMJ52668.1 chemotaxis protein [Vogesella sp. EB]
MSSKGTMSLRRRLQLQVVLVAVLLCIIGGITLYFERASLYADREAKVRNLVESAVTLIKGYEEMAAAGKLSEADAKQQAITVLNSMRYDEREYFFAFDPAWVWVAHGAKPQLAGTNLKTIKDPTGVNLGELFETAVRDGNGRNFVSYVWDKPGFDQPQPKLSYLATSGKWGWVVGTGIYLDDVALALRNTALLLFAEIFVALLLVVLIGYLTRRSVMQQLGGEPALTRDVVRQIAQGQLNVAVPVAASDKDSLLAAVADMQQHLRELVGGIADSSQSLTGMAGNISGSATAVATGSEQQSRAASDMAASIEELTASIKQISELASHAHAVSASSGQLSHSGGEVISRAVDEMHRINESVDQAALTIGDLVSKTQTISTIMQVIKDIADQTNLLALNAAIEAARAGELGRGFAVVADEVRKLSERTGQATQEIAVMIREIQNGSEASRSNMEEAVERVKSGLALAEKGGESIRQIRDSAGGVVAVVNDISQALSEQGHASEEITRHVEQIAQAAAQNAEAAGHTSGAIGELHGLTGNLRQMVSRFHV